MATGHEGADPSGAAATPTLSLSHIGLQVHDLPRMRAFYTEVMGMRVSDHGVSPRRGSAMLFLSGEEMVHHHLVLIDGAGAEAVAGCGRLDHHAFAVGSLGVLRAMRDRARAAGISVDAVDHGCTWSLYLSDPENNRIEVFTPSRFVVPQPYGRPLDLDLSDAEIVAATQSACT